MILLCSMGGRPCVHHRAGAGGGHFRPAPCCNPMRSQALMVSVVLGAQWWVRRRRRPGAWCFCTFRTCTITGTTLTVNVAALIVQGQGPLSPCWAAILVWHSPSEPTSPLVMEVYENGCHGAHPCLSPAFSAHSLKQGVVGSHA